MSRGPRRLLVRLGRGGRGRDGARRVRHADDGLDHQAGGILRRRGLQAQSRNASHVGVKAISESFDTVGVIARTVADAALVVGALSRRPLEPPRKPTVPRLAICRTHEWPAAAPETEALFDALPELLAQCGARPTHAALPGAFAALRRRRTRSGRSRSPAAWRTSTCVFAR